MRPIHSNVARVLGMSVTSAAVIYHSPATGSVTGSSLRNSQSRNALEHDFFSSPSERAAELSSRSPNDRAAELSAVIVASRKGV